MIPRSSSRELDVIHAPSRCTSITFFVLNRIWHLPRLTFILLFANQEKSLLAVDCSCVITLGMSSAQEYGAVSSANLQFQNQQIQKRSIKSMLNSNGPKIKPCGTPYSLLVLSLSLVLILTRCVRFER